MKQFLKEAIEYALAQGRLTIENGELFFDGEVIESHLPHTPDEYRPTGWSVETSHGCCRHREVDLRLDAMLAGSDPVEKQIAAEFPRWFGFIDTLKDADGKRVVETPWSLNEDETHDLMRAHERYVILWYWIVSGSRATRTWLADFWLREDNEWVAMPGHSYIFCEAPREQQIETLENRLPASILSEIERRVAVAKGG